MRESQVIPTATITAAAISNSGRAATLTKTQGPCYLPEFGGSCFFSEAAFCCAAFVLPDDTCADAMLQSVAAANKANSILVLITYSFPDGPI
jgi:hypothetical protein